MCICLSTCLLEAGIVSKRLRGSSVFLCTFFFRLILQCFKEIMSTIQNRRTLPTGTLFKLWKWTACAAARAMSPSVVNIWPDDRRLLITLRIQLCVLCDERDAPRRADPSAAADTCFDQHNHRISERLTQTNMHIYCESKITTLYMPRHSSCTAVVRDRRRLSLCCRALWLDWNKGSIIIILSVTLPTANRFSKFLHCSIH